MQNYKKYGIRPAQLIIADVPYNVGNNFYGSNTGKASWLESRRLIQILTLISTNISISVQKC